MGTIPKKIRMQKSKHILPSALFDMPMTNSFTTKIPDGNQYCKMLDASTRALLHHDCHRCTERIDRHPHHTTPHHKMFSDPQKDFGKTLHYSRTTKIVD